MGACAGDARPFHLPRRLPLPSVHALLLSHLFLAPVPPPVTDPTQLGQRHPLTGKTVLKPLSPTLEMLKGMELPDMPALAEEDVARAKDAFIEVDMDGSGFLEAEELVLTIKKLGHDVSVTRVKVRGGRW
jgi:hypothetical protein